MKKIAFSLRLRLLGAMVACLATMPLQAKIKLPHILSDGMVVQQQADVCFWGWTTPNTNVLNPRNEM